MAAYSTLVGLYPSSNSNILIDDLMATNSWPEILPWQPIPVHTGPRSIDHVCSF